MGDGRRSRHRVGRGRLHAGRRAISLGLDCVARGNCALRLLRSERDCRRCSLRRGRRSLHL